jgi:predicted phosphoadenosine phosphosulfate sulfurtransferase
MYAECFPEMWHKMIARVKGAATAARYGNTELYASGFKPDQVDWRSHVENVLAQYSGPDKRAVRKGLNAAINQHKARTQDPIPNDSPHPLSGASWKFLSKMVTRGDFKQRVAQTMQQEGAKTRMKMGITYEQAIEKYGRPLVLPPVL